MKIYNRREFMKTCGVGLTSLAVPSCRRRSETKSIGAAIKQPNVLFISVDDLNDWIEPLGGHPQAKTPNLTRFAEQSVNFTRNYCASPSCNPSRTSLMTGIHCYNSGMYSNYQVWREVLPEAQTLPQYFSSNGYWAGGAGKIFHNNMPDPQSWD
ncbi:MAG: sulfatase-like hydrolase/transferase, partial [Candidatus Aminicenantaceae bacterium]